MITLGYVHGWMWMYACRCAVHSGYEYPLLLLAHTLWPGYDCLCYVMDLRLFAFGVGALRGVCVILVFISNMTSNLLLNTVTFISCAQQSLRVCLSVSLCEEYIAQATATKHSLIQLYQVTVTRAVQSMTRTFLSVAEKTNPMHLP